MDDVRSHGAVGDGVTLDHAAFQRAIDRCAAAGGGMVLVPPGRYRCGTVKLRSRVRLHLEAGAEIHGSDREDDYEPITQTQVGPTPRTSRALFWADDEDDVAVTGHGSIHGGGGLPLPGPEYVSTRFRPAVFLFSACQGVRLQDVEIKDSRYWTIHLLRCRDVRVRGITVSNHRQRISSVGVVVDCSRDVLVGDSVIEAGDDAVAVKSTQEEACENVVVSNCVLRSSQAALKVGAQSVGLIRNVMCANCIIEDSFIGIGVYMKDGGTYDNLSFCNLAIRADSEFPVIIDATARECAAERSPGRIRDVRLSGITVHGRGRCYIQGQPQAPIERMILRDLSWAVNAYCDGRKARKMRGSEHVSPQAGGSDFASEPFQFVFAHVVGLRMADVSCNLSVPLPHPDRGLLRLHDVHDAAFADLRGLEAPYGQPAVLVTDCGELHGLSGALRTGSAVVSGMETGERRAMHG